MGGAVDPPGQAGDHGDAGPGEGDPKTLGRPEPVGCGPARADDRYGHLVGSQTLRHLSSLLQGCVRQVDTLARYGGDEFTILLPDTPLEAGLAVAERIRRTVGEEIFEAGRDTPIRLTISIGVGAYPQHGSDRASLLDAADKAMYRAKSLGRNCVCSASDLDRPRT